MTISKKLLRCKLVKNNTDIELVMVLNIWDAELLDKVFLEEEVRDQ